MNVEGEQNRGEKMKRKILFSIVSISIVTFMVFVGRQVVFAENIDPYDDDSQYAYGENVGWLNFEPLGDGGPGVEVSDSALTGYIWAENIGWINLSPTQGGVANDGDGNLSGYGWGENVGWINFAPTFGGVTIDPTTGEFSDYGWGENIGWINFALLQGRAKTSWPAVQPAEPSLCPDQYRWSGSGYEWDPYPDLFRSWQEVRFVNSGAGDAFHVTATISCVPENVTVVDGDVTLGDIPAGESVWSADAFTLETDMTHPSDPDQGICWRVEYDDEAGVHHVVEDVAQFCGQQCSDICSQ